LQFSAPMISASFHTTALLRYGLLALPLAFAALPLYVLLPLYYSTHYAVSLAALGSLLLVARLFDAFADPFIGRYIDKLLISDKLLTRDKLGRSTALWQAAAAAVVMVTGFAALWWAPKLEQALQLAWLALALSLTYLAYSFLTVLHQSWGTQLSAVTTEQSRISAFREGAALIGVMIASVLPSLAGERALPVALALALIAALWGLSAGPQPRFTPSNDRAKLSILPLSQAFLRIKNNANYIKLCIVYLVNGVAAAVPATLILFFVQDRLQAQSGGPFLLAYFLAAAASLPLWVQAVKRIGLERAWLCGMLLAIATFVWASTLGAGDSMLFYGVCLASGLAAGADLALPAALVARSIHAAGHSGQLEGSYFGLWGFLTKLNLALAAGLALPLLQWLGYTPGVRDAAALSALTIGYCLIPCALKLIAAGLLYGLFIAGKPFTATSVDTQTHPTHHETPKEISP
jgi:glycoside/pentoside/hexuronide:cation symporter, GPH family